ncbi:alpha/beta hydrolase [Nocardia neocaledoniensis NBRC 108232]|uniref:Alpha/beta hydrolase family protein n=1 Tax=Nocardia neocaledoniensis TaxID=236511 RepID=A0A317NVR8_9NOCA|nr:alpha/beta hydrolase [Nocardia neocaledoniensis]PWV79135.1 alpha/beta hydrolase family protein [Nocardia neocaledoniensis]GEM33196.1 alpha/beta hydrolase [Nocardia neocaledoniensis NBRC 108232]
MSQHLTVPQVESWKPAAFGAQAAEFTRQAAELRNAIDTQYRAVDGSRETFRRKTGDAMRARFDQVRTKALLIADALDRGKDAATSAQWTVGSAQGFLAAKKADAVAKSFEVRDDGTCVITETAKQRLYSSIASQSTDPTVVAEKYTTGMAALQVDANTHTAAVKAALTGAMNADTAAKTAIEAAFENLPTPESFGNATTPAAAAPQPPVNGTAEDNRKWWDSLTTTQKNEILSSSPGSVGNLDGLPAEVRDKANRAMIQPEYDRLVADKARFEDAVVTAGATGDMAGVAEAQTGLDRTNQKIKDLEAVRAAVGDSAAATNPPRYLMALDMQSGRQGRAAVAVGNPDTADHISVTTPGLGSDLDETLLGGGTGNLHGGMIGEAEQLIRTSETQLGNAGRGDENVAAIAWFGYDPPQGGMSLEAVEPDMINVTNEGRAQEAAAPLSSFYDGLDVASEKNDPHITALGHSYGSLATSLALQEQSGVVDDVVFYGSPGLGAEVPGLPGISGAGSPITNLGWNDAVENAGDLGLRNGHVYEMSEDRDPVANLDAFGRSPNSMPWVTHLSTDPITVTDPATGKPMTFSGATGHSEYGRTDGTTGQLHRSGYNLAAIVAGLPENATDPKTVR